MKKIKDYAITKIALLIIFSFGIVYNLLNYFKRPFAIFDAILQFVLFIAVFKEKKWVFDVFKFISIVYIMIILYYSVQGDFSYMVTVPFILLIIFLTYKENIRIKSAERKNRNL